MARGFDTGDLIIRVYFALVDGLKRAQREEKEVPHRAVALNIADLEARMDAAGYTHDGVVGGGLAGVEWIFDGGMTKW